MSAKAKTSRSPKIHEDFHGKNGPSDSVLFKIPKRNCGWQIKKRTQPKETEGKNHSAQESLGTFPEVGHRSLKMRVVDPMS